MPLDKNNECSQRELKILGDYWTLSIIQSLSEGEKRFCQLERDLGVSSPTTLTARLKTLEIHKIIQRKSETIDKISVSYSLTSKGKAILPVLQQIKIFALKYL